MTETILIGAGDSWHIAHVYYSPVERSGCPSGKDCGVYSADSANLWKCIGSNFSKCYPVGDNAYGLEMTYVYSAGIARGVIAEYAGGAEGNVTRVEFDCHPSLEFGRMVWESVSDQESDGLHVHVYTREVCAHEEWGQLAAGAFFILGVYAFVVGYFGVVTVVNWFLSGKVEPPNGEFWETVYLSLWTAIQFFTALRCSMPSVYAGLATEPELESGGEASGHSPGPEVVTNPDPEPDEELSEHSPPPEVAPDADPDGGRAEDSPPPDQVIV
jgi:hypothetical protein